MSDKAIEVIAGVLTAAIAPRSPGWDRMRAEAILAALKVAGIALVELPEPTGEWAEGPEWLQGNRLGDRSGWVTWTAHEACVMLQRIEPGELTAEGARELAAALLAAASAAEAVTS